MREREVNLVPGNGNSSALALTVCALSCVSASVFQNTGARTMMTTTTTFAAAAAVLDLSRSLSADHR